ncbi:LuxR family transcriptional regulator [Catenulispora yoronensis]|uniref:LuxR family transcriptional regulator n=2 Tax=Catenulispora yoronensis TaxID=450799 RepID=A0ABP5FHK9_9ACTN
MSSALVLVGEAGIGKTRLLDHLARTSTDLRVVRTAGVETEARLGYAALHRLLRPLLADPDAFEALPAPQHEALAAAFGLRAGPTPDRYLVGLAVLTLLAGTAAAQPLLCLVDDVQWLDRESAEVLAFVGRRLGAEGIGLVVAGRTEGSGPAAGEGPGSYSDSYSGSYSDSSDPSDSYLGSYSGSGGPFDGFTALPVRGLAETDAHALLRHSVLGLLDPEVATRIVADTGGNPLALTEIADALSPAHLAGAAPLHEPLPVGARLENHFRRLIQDLPEPTRAFLLLLSAASPEDPVLLWRAAGELGVPAAAADEALSAGLITGDHLIEFRHPLIRSAVYRGADATLRRRVHRALAAVTDPVQTPERRAWHSAEATIGLDDTVAGELETASERARARGGYAEQAAFLARAAELSVVNRAGRLVEAVQAHLVLGDPHSARSVLEQAEPLLADDPLLRARALYARAKIGMLLAQLTGVPALLMSAADTVAVAGNDPGLARRMLLEGLVATLYSGHDRLREFGEAVLDSPALRPSGSAPLGPDSGADLMLRGFALRMAEGYPQCVPVLRAAIAAICRGEESDDQTMPVAELTIYAGDETWDDDALRAVEVLEARARQTRALGALRAALLVRSSWELRAGRFSVATMCLDEAEDLAVVTGQPTPGDAYRIELLAYSGRESETRAAARLVAEDWVEANDHGGFGDWARYSLTVLELSLGRYAEAAALARVAFGTDNPGAAARILPDLVEAAARSGDELTAKDALRRLEERATVAGTPWALGLLARCRALMSDDDQTASLFEEAVELLDRTPIRTESARAHLLYGEWLRRRKRRAEARAELRTAYDMFETMGAAGFAERARVELLATGEHARKRTTRTGHGLTPQERRIAELAAAGSTNAEIATRLFITQSTIEYHLNKVFRKLDITSRRQLRTMLAEG